MVRRLAVAAGLAAASLIAFAPAASAQTYGGVTLSFGSGGYQDYNYGYPGYRRYYDDDARYRWEARRRYEQHERWEQRQRWLQHERWEQERARRDYWRHEQREHSDWGDDDD